VRAPLDLDGHTRRFEIKNLSVPVSEAQKLRDFYRVIADDERNSAVLKRVSQYWDRIRDAVLIAPVNSARTVIKSADHRYCVF
jgi:hypothetical protein